MDNKNENKNSLSPTPVKEEKRGEEGEVLMNFGQAMEVVILGKKIHKLEWKDKKFYGVLDNEILKLHKPDDQLYSWTISKGDLAGTDYIII